MPATIGAGVSLRGIYDTKYNHVWNISGTPTQADVGKAVTQDVAASATAKLTTDGAKVIGMLFSYENRTNEGIKIGTVSHKGYFVFPYTGTAPSIGHGVVGSATAGAVKGTTAAAVPGQPTVVDIDTTAGTVLVSCGVF